MTWLVAIRMGELAASAADPGATPDWLVGLGLLVAIGFVAVAIWVLNHMTLGGPWL